MNKRSVFTHLVAGAVGFLFGVVVMFLCVFMYAGSGATPADATGFTEAQLDDMYSIEAEIQGILAQYAPIQYGNKDDVADALLAFLNMCEESGRISNVFDDRDNGMISFAYSAGVLGGVQYYEFYRSPDYKGPAVN